MSSRSETLADLLAQSRALRPTPRAATLAYRGAMQSLMAEVTERMAAHPRYQEFLGRNAPALLVDNHRNHVLFMDEVFESGKFDLLALTLPWVYHAYHAHGVHYDYFAAELAIWKRAVEGQLAPEQAAAIGDVYDWLIAKHDSVVALAEERANQADESQPAADLADLFEALTSALLDGDGARVLELCRGAQAFGTSLPGLLQGLIYPAMQRVGTLWESGRISVADEHQATAIMNRVLAALYYEQTFPDAKRGRALVAACVNEYHEMGAWMVATCLELDGWDVDYLGANVPNDDLLRKADAVAPQLIALSVSMPFSLRQARTLIATLRERLPTSKILLGGHVFRLLPALGAEMGADACLEDCEAAMRWARENCHQAAGHAAR